MTSSTITPALLPLLADPSPCLRWLVLRHLLEGELDALAIGATFETWRLAGELERWMILPGLSLVWRPFDPPTEPIEPEPPLEVEPLD